MKYLLLQNQISYQVKDLNDEIIFGRFYKHEVQKVYKYKKTTFDVEIFKKRKGKNKIEYFVHWKDHPSSSDRWVKDIDLL